ncbi:MAG TPA: hypothetical protein VNF03_07620 [Patescibacteria group bacterium]|nr:hypothetical protein [Patescibacteria group bacterium]
MRLTKRDTERATAELLMLVRNNPGIATSALRGTRFFNGARTLSCAQVVRLLRAAGLRPRACGAGARTWYEWRLPAEAAPLKDGTTTGAP